MYQIAGNPSGSGNGEVAGAAFREALQKITSAVIIIATTVEGRSFGVTLTSTAIAAASTEPPMLGVGLNAGAPIARKIRQAGCLSVNFVSDEQHELVRELLDPNLTSDQTFKAGDLWTRQATGAPVLLNAVVSMDCSVEEMRDSGTNVLFTVRVRAIATSDKGSLLYRDGMLRRLDADF